MVSRAHFIRLLLAEGDWTDHLNNHVAFAAWMSGEFSPGVPGARFNPLATTHPMKGATDFNSSHVKNYVSLEQGVAATVATIKLPRYAAIPRNLRVASAAVTTLEAVMAAGSWTRFPSNLGNYVEGVRSRWSQHAYAPVSE